MGIYANLDPVPDFLSSFPTIIHLHTAGLLRLRDILIPWALPGSPWNLPRLSFGSPLFCLSRDRALPVVTTAVLVSPTVCQKSLRSQDLAKLHLTQALNPKSLSSWSHPSTLPFFWFGVLITRLGLQAPSLWTPGSYQIWSHLSGRGRCGLPQWPVWSWPYGPC